MAGQESNTTPKENKLNVKKLYETLARIIGEREGVEITPTVRLKTEEEKSA